MHLGAKAIFCPSVSQKNVVLTKMKRCPNGKELMKGAEISMAFAGGGPYIIRGKQLKGCLAFAVEVLSQKFGFKYDLKPARGFNMLIANVSSSKTWVHWCLFNNFHIAIRFPGGMFK